MKIFKYTEFNYINENRNFLREIAKEVKKKYKDFKFSIRTSFNKIDIDILEGNIELRKDPSNDYETVNPYNIDRTYEDMPIVRDILKDIVNMVSAEQTELTYDSDYGSVPTYYVRLGVGSWDKPYKVR